MIEKNKTLEEDWKEYLVYLQQLAIRKYNDCDDIDALIQDTAMALIRKANTGEIIEHPKGFLSAVMKNKYNQWLRRKYYNEIVFYDYSCLSELESNDWEIEDADWRREEYTAVRRELGRLLQIYREVAVRHYIHGHSVEKIATDLGISVGTVKSRLSNARNRIKEGLTNMKQYANISYEPKKLSLGIWGNDSLQHEPFSLISSPIEKNILILAYEKPVSILEIADTMGISCAYLEPLVNKLIRGELMGQTPSGLVYTRCYVRTHKDSFGDIPAQEALADSMAERVWETVWKYLEPLTHRNEFSIMTQKQKATLLLYVLHHTLADTVQSCSPVNEKAPKQLPERPNGGRWLATATVFDPHESLCKYDSSGPVQVSYRTNTETPWNCQMFDFQSLFGDTHWIYSQLKYNCGLQEILRFFGSLLPCNVKPSNKMIAELVPDFEKMFILRRKENGSIALDIPAMTFDEHNQYWVPAMRKIKEELRILLRAKITELWNNRKNRIPKHVDEYSCFRHDGAVGIYAIAQTLAIVEKGLMPYSVTVGKTPIIYVLYQKNDQ